MAMLLELPVEIQQQILVHCSADEMKETVRTCKKVKDLVTIESFRIKYAKKYPHAEYFMSPLSTTLPLDAPKMTPLCRTLKCVRQAESFLPITPKVLRLNQSAELGGWQVKYYEESGVYPSYYICIGCPDEGFGEQETPIGINHGVWDGRRRSPLSRRPYHSVMFIVLGASLVCWVCDVHRSQVEYRIFGPKFELEFAWKTVLYETLARLTPLAGNLFWRMRNDSTFEILAKDALPANHRAAYDLAQQGYYKRDLEPEWGPADIMEMEPLYYVEPVAHRDFSNVALA